MGFVVFQLELEVVRLMKSPSGEKKNYIKERQTEKASSDVLAVLVHIKSGREKKQ